jgi:hypothetical protein
MEARIASAQCERKAVAKDHDGGGATRESAISLQSLNANYPVLPCPYSAARAL